MNSDVSELTDVSDISGNEASDAEDTNPWDLPENVSWWFLKTGKDISFIAICGIISE